jgi:transposase
MNPYPEMRSTLVLDNCRIHHNEALLQLVQAFGCHILFLPAYSPDLNPIEESFSACKYNFPLVCISVLNPDAL